jgi:hypothetical protein
MRWVLFRHACPRCSKTRLLLLVLYAVETRGIWGRWYAGAGAQRAACLQGPAPPTWGSGCVCVKRGLRRRQPTHFASQLPPKTRTPNSEGVLRSSQRHPSLPMSLVPGTGRTLSGTSSPQLTQTQTPSGQLPLQLREDSPRRSPQTPRASGSRTRYARPPTVPRAASRSDGPL